MRSFENESIAKEVVNVTTDTDELVSQLIARQIPSDDSWGHDTITWEFEDGSKIVVSGPCDNGSREICGFGFLN